MDYKNTLNLPRTDFAMKADLVAREPQRLARWEAEQIYAQIRQARAGKEKFVLHDGPPFANGDVHVGTALNKVLKDIIVKYKSLRGFDAPYIPGWDCHGLPIEFKVTQDMRKASDTSSDAATIRTACDAYARKYIDLQRTQFKRLGVFGDWGNSYLTLNKEYEADELRLFADLVAQGFVYRGKKPVYWSIPCRTALAEAEVEYADHVSQSVYVKFKLAGEPNTFLLIWTTTPWTLPANLAVAFNPDLYYSRIHADGNVYLVCNSLLESVTQKCSWVGGYQIERTVSADELATLTYEHPFCARTGRLFPAGFVTADTGTGFVHIAPGHGADDYNLGRSQGLPIYSPVDDAGCLAHTADLPADQQMPAEMLGKSILEKHGRSDANDAVLHELRVRNALAHQENYHHSYPHCWRSKTPIIFRAMDQWFIKIDHVAADVRRLHSNAEPGTQNAEQSQSLLTSAATFRDRALAEIDRVNWIPDWGKNRIEGAVKSRPDWCISRQRSWGVPIPAFYDAQGEPILDAAIVRRAADLFEQHGSNVWFEKTAAELWTLCRPTDWTGREATAKSADTLDVWIDSGSSSRAVLMRRTELQHDKPSTPELSSLHDKLTGRPSNIAGEADPGGPRQGQTPDSRLELRLAEQRRARFHALRAAAAQAPRGGSTALEVISLDALGWKADRASRAALKRTYEVFTEDASTRLAYVGEGMEAFVYRAPENPGVVYKFYPRNLDLQGHGLYDAFKVTDDGCVDYEPEYSDRLVDLLNKLYVLDALGLPTEVLGVTEEGAIVVKQREIIEATGELPSAPVLTSAGVEFFEVPRSVFAATPAQRSQSSLVRVDRQWWLISDMWERNRLEDTRGVTHIIDAVITPLPEPLLATAPRLREFLAALEAAGITEPPTANPELKTQNSKLAWQADVYLEGSDQHRGWFQSSLLLSLAGNGAAPFKTVLTHGFMVDEDREKISKSKQGQGAYTKPQTADRYVNEYGADVLRLWVASQDYRTDITVSEERLKKVSETYRGIRNALRYQLSNLYDFDPAQHTVPDAQLTGLDRWVLGEFAKLEAAVATAYDAYEFHVVYQKLSQFAAVELSSIYHDVVKDRLYTDPANSARRRSTQTALHRMVTRLCQMLAPVLVFTADEAWEFIPGKPTPSVHLSEWEPALAAVDATGTDPFTLLLHVRSLCQMELEKGRQAKTFGKALGAEVALGLPSEIAAEISAKSELLQEMLNVSHLSCSISSKGIIEITVSAARGQKCERCWHTEPTVGANTGHPTLCPRCIEAVSQCLSVPTTSFV